MAEILCNTTFTMYNSFSTYNYWNRILAFDKIWKRRAGWMFSMETPWRQRSSTVIKGRDPVMKLHSNLI